MKNINEKIANLSAEKRALLELRLKNKNTHISKKQAIPRRSDHDSPRLSFAQERLWFLEQLEPNNLFYNVPRAVLLQGNLNQQVLQLALSEIVRRHEVLRTSFRTVNDTPVQVIHPEVAIAINVVDLQKLPDKERQTFLQQQIQKEAITPFNLEIAPLIRCSLFQLDTTEYVLLLTMHHIVSDGWSIGVFIQELSTLYQAFCIGETSPLPELPIQYADFAVWQRQWLSEEVFQNQLNYWKQQLGDAPELLQLPSDRPRPTVQSYRGTTQSFSLNADLTQKLQTLSQNHSTTLFMTLYAAFATLLYRYSGQSDILIGSGIANRNHSEIESLIGFFVNTLVLRSRFEDNPSFESLLAQVRETTLKAYENQDVPFEQVVEALQPQRSLAYSPLFQVAFTLQNTPMSELQFSNVTLTPLTPEIITTKFDLTVLMSQTPSGLMSHWEYSTDLFDQSTIDRMAAHFQNLLSAIVENPSQTVGELPLLSEAERYQLLIEWNDTESEYPTDKCIHQLFEEQVEKTPDAVAVVFENQQLTYHQLNQKANRLAHHLQNLGVRSELLVGVCVERSIEMIVGILGILKAGGAYVPLDPNYPQERLSYMLKDSGVEMLLTQQSLLESLPSHTARVVCLDMDWGAIAIESDDNPDIKVKSENLAYVIYTSGSTGNPKGVLVTHRGLPNLVMAQKNQFNVQSQSRVLQFASFSFDASVSEIFMALSSGATLVLAKAELLMPGSDLTETLTQFGITHVTLPPSALSVLLPDEFPELGQIIVAGETCSTELVKQWSNGRCFFNAYGPTESTVCATIAEISNSNPKPIIGRPIANTQIYILDRNNQPVPIGVAGEIHIGGVGLARSYRNRPELTLEKFISNPFVPKSKLYKTGDLARFLPDGNIEFLGRIDDQVKIRGFRIELGEIESVLSTYPQIQQVTVIAREDTPGNKRLVAYLVPHQAEIELWPSVAEFYVYDELLYYAMTNDYRRNQSYQVAINQLVKDKVVVEIGTGKDAILAKFCAEAGAKKVYAIERNYETSQLASTCVQELGLSEQIKIIHGDATTVDLPELADVCVSEIVGPIGGCEGAAVIINNTRRFLKPDGVMIPQRSMTQIIGITLPDELLNQPRFTKVSGYYTQKIFEQVGYPFDLRLCIKGLNKANWLSNRGVFEDLDFSKPISTEFTHQIKLTIEKSGRLDGFFVGLNLHTIEGECIDILEHEHCWLPVYFPVFEPGINVDEGDVIEAFCTRTLCENNLNPNYAIRGHLLKTNGEDIEFEYISYHWEKMFKQTPFYQRLFADNNLENYAINQSYQQKVLSSTELRSHLQRKLPDYMIPGAFVILESLPLTANGKVDKKALSAPDGILQESKYIAPRTEIEKILTKIWQELLLLEKVSIHDNFFEIGGDSILSIQVVSRAKNSGIQITPKQIFQNQTIAELAKVANTTANVNAKQGLVTGIAPLTPIQHWFFAQKTQQSQHHFNQSVLLEIPKNIKAELLEKAVEKLLEHHDALRLRFRLQASEYKQINQSLDDAVPFTVVDLSSTPKLEQPQTLEQIATEYQASLNLSDGPIMQVVMFNLGVDEDARLLIIIHHLAVDGVSWRILLSDLETIYQQLIAQQPIKLSPKTTAYIDWAEKLNNYAQSQIIKQQLDYWREQPWSKTKPLPSDYPQTQSENTVGSAINYRVNLNQQETRSLLLSVNEAYNTQINDILLSALVLTLAQWTENSTVVINLEGHGREELFSDVDLSRTVGWFTSLFPVFLQLPTDYQLASVIKSIKEQLRAIPNRGIGYGILRYLCEDTAVTDIQTLITPEISFNYLGQFDQVQLQTGWKFASESTGANQSSKLTREHLLDINALVIEGELQINWAYSSNVHAQATVENLAQSYIQAIRSIIEHCQLEENRGYTPCDFPLAQLNQVEIDELLAAIKTKDICAIYPLSPTQQGMLFHSLYAPDSGVYFEQMTLNLKGNLNVAAFELAWQKVVDRHSVLRTLFVWENRKTPLQVVLKQVNLPWNNLDWQGLSTTEQQQQLSELLQTQRRLGFQFNQAPLMACTLVRLDEDNYKFIWNHHHILMDGWCLPIIFKEVISFYEGEVTAQTFSLPTPTPYGDYIAWLNSQNQEIAFEFWRQTLQGFSAPTPLVVDNNQYQKEYKNSDYKELELTLSAQTSRGLQDLAQQHHVTLSTIVQAVWALLLSRYSDEKDVVFGVIVSGRPSNLSGIEKMVGLFINTLPLRLQISPQQQLIPWLQQIQQLMLELQDYSYTPLVEIQSMSEVTRGTPLFESIVVFENYPLERSLLNQDDSLKVTEIEGFEQNNYPLTVVAVPRDELLIKISYDTVRFELDTIERMLGHLQTIFCAIVENPSQTVGELPLLTQAERHQLLTEWNDTATEYPTDKCIHQLFEQQVEKTPHCVAVVFENQQLTYQQLNQRANQLAYHLQSLGVGAEVLVGICVERSIEMLVGLLGILKAGGAYIPFDPNYPQERLSYMLEDSDVEVLLTQQSLLQSLPQHQAHVICLDTDWVSIEQYSHHNLDVEVASDNLAYVIYTSGSTGQPKGVAIEQQSLVNHSQAIIKKYGLTCNDRILQFANFGFDVVYEEIFPTFLRSATLIIAEEKIFSSFANLSQLIEQQKLTVLNLPVSYWQGWIWELSQLKDVELPLSLRLVVVGSEVVAPKQLRLWFKHTRDNVSLLNAYGSTETTITATVYEPTTDFQSDKSVPIGRPIANTSIYILDHYLQPVPIGVPGELHIGGLCLARGYLNRPKLTLEKFIPDPFSNQSSARLYKTGDLARYLADGNIEFLSRIDNQLKVRGFRIEPGEIESVLTAYPQVQQAVVVATEDIHENKRLVAYVVTDNKSLTTNQLREFLKQNLPDYMIPGAFVILESLPLTANGKVDKKALSAPDGILQESKYIAPRTEIEKILTKIWQELLLLEKVSIHDNFFEIGGDSILSIQVVSRAKNSGIQITPKQIFQNQTIAELAKVANTTANVNAKQGLVTGIAPLTPIQHWFFAQKTQQSQHHFNQSVLLEIPKNIKAELLEKAVEKLLEHHDALRLRFRLQASEYKQINQSLDDAVPFTVVDLSSTPKLEQPQTLEQIATEYQASLNLSDGPIMQVVMFNLGVDEDARLLIIIHHLAVDGVSWRILLSDLETIYQQLIAQQPIKLSPKTTAYIDWAEKLNNYAQSQIIKQQLDYWREQPWSKTKPLPSDYPQTQSENTVGSAINYRVNLNQQETRSLLLSVNEAYNTQINDILLSALVLTLAQWTGNSTVVINLEGHGREELFSDVDLSRTVGWFTSLFPVFLQLPTDYQLASVIKSIKEQLRAIPNRGIGYGILRYLCEDTAVTDIQTLTTPEISFNYLGQFDQVQLQTGWKFASESTGANQSSKLTREHLLDINALVIEGELQINWAYSSNVHAQATVENLAQSYIQAIRSIIEHCQLEENRGYTPCDFPLAQLNQVEIDELLAAIKTKDICAIYPLSPTQQGMLFHSLYAPDSGVYFEQMTLNLKGNLNVAAFELAWQKVVDRHSVLRTLFVWENRKTPLQVVLKQVNLPWNNLDWQGLSTTEQQQQLSELLQTQRRLGFQFNQAPLMACTLVRLDEDNYKFIWNHHHILMDGWCLPIIFKEVISFYEGEVTAQTFSLPTPTPYGDYIAWLNSQNQEIAFEFWRQTLQGFSAPTPLVVDNNQYQKEYKNSDYKELELTLSAQTSRGLQDLAQQHHVTLSTIVQAVWALLLSRYSDEKDVVFGVIVSGRPSNLSGIEKMVGLFINTLPLRLQISPQQQLIPWLQQIQQLMLELQDYSYTPLVEIQSMSEVTRGTPLFESIVVFENYPLERSLLNQDDSLKVTEIEGFEQNNYPLTVVAVPRDELLIKISYDTVRFELDTIERMLGHLQTIFCAIVENPSQTVGELPLLTQAERHQLLTEWNDTATEYPTDKCIHQLFEQQVEKTPHCVAVVFENQQLTYQQLNQRANQLAYHLQSLGVGAEVLVGICVERSIEMLVGLLGILKAGGAYIPFDPNYPQERLSYMLEDSDVEVLLTQQSLLQSLPQHQAHVICLDTDWVSIEQYSHHNLDVEVASDNLAYVIYTSGSTGQPKGVAIEQQSLVNFLNSMSHFPGLTQEDTFYAVTTISFDIAALELYLPLTVGAKVIVASRSIASNANSLLFELFKSKITVMQATPVTWQMLLASGWSSNYPLKVLCGGEALSAQLAHQILETGSELWNLYGPTEATIWSTIYQLGTKKTVARTENAPSPIGRPIANTQIYILDSHLQPVPIGVPGELYISGDGLARSYLNRSELTQEKFIPSPFSNSKCKRLYKTGDLACYGSDGSIKFLGRIDNQVKVRGFRIELGEIESVLNTHPQIQQAVVTAREDIPGNKRLVAYIVIRDELLTTDQLREFIKQKLPEYMVPSAFVTLDTLPLTANGKVDRKALPTPDQETFINLQYIPPRNRTEEVIADIFASVLSIQKVGIYDNFFTLGGHSLLATQVISRVKQAFAVDVPLRNLFEEPTIANLSKIIDNSDSTLVQQLQTTPFDQLENREEIEL